LPIFFIKVAKTVIGPKSQNITIKPLLNLTSVTIRLKNKIAHFKKNDAQKHLRQTMF
jgi:hypothetical protein